MRNRIALLAPLFIVPALLAADPLREVLAQMDASAISFRDVRAKVDKESYTAIIDDRTTESGVMLMSRAGGKARDVRMKIDFTDPDPRSVAFSGNKGEIYYPKIKTVQEYNLGKHKALVEAFLLLGFGTSGQQLAKDYSLKFVGEEEINGVASAHLELTPKSKKAKEKITKVELWVARDGAYPVRQRFTAPSGDTTTISFRDIEINPGLNAKQLMLDLPKGVKREYPQK